MSESAAARAHGVRPAPALRNVYACLVHESQECVIDLVRNLRCLDPDSSVLLYNGGADARLLEPVSCFDKLGAFVHPASHPLDTRTLHEFAFDSMGYALERVPFDTLTIVDSDQLGLRAGWSSALAQQLSGKARVGLLGGGVAGGAPERQPKTTRVTPAIGAWQELPLWRPLLARFPHGEAQFPRWAAWPGMVFTSDAARALTTWWNEDAELRRIVGESRMWAKEQILFPTLTALLGFRVLPSPGSQDYIKYEVTYDPSDAQAALESEGAYWIHPVARRYDDASRRVVRSRFNQYRPPSGARSATIVKQSIPLVGDELRQPILREMKSIEGWLTAGRGGPAHLRHPARPHRLPARERAGRGRQLLRSRHDRDRQRGARRAPDGTRLGDRSARRLRRRARRGARARGPHPRNAPRQPAAHAAVPVRRDRAVQGARRALGRARVPAPDRRPARLPQRAQGLQPLRAPPLRRRAGGLP